MLVVVIALCSAAVFPDRLPDPQAGAEPLAPPAVHAASDADARLAAAKAALDGLRLEEAASILELLVADPAAGEHVRAQAWLTLGLTRASLLDDDGARVAFAAALAIDGTLAPPPDSSPKVTRLFDRTRARLPAGGTLAPAVEAPVSAPPEPAPTAPLTTTSSPPPSVAGAADPGVYVGTTVVGGVLLALSAAAVAGALVADNALGTAVAGRTRDEYDGIKALGVSGVVGGAVLGVAGAAGLVIGIGGMVQ